MPNFAELKELWIKNGGSPADAATAAAIAMAESGGRATARNTNKNGSVDIGLWQINSVHRGAFGLPKDLQAFEAFLTNPNNNAKAAVAIKKVQGWNAWVAYKNNKHLPFLKEDL